MIEVIDNFLSHNDYEKISNIMLGPHFPWSYQHKILDDAIISCSEKYNYQFIHSFYRDLKERSEYFYLMDLFFPLLKIKAWVKIKANMNPSTDESIVHGYHRDCSFLCKTAVYYVNSNNGYTIFENGKKVESVANRIVIFNSNISHSGVTSTDEKVRVVINLNYF